ncbi:hypothetical protein R1sor_013289 [Riccia sorocarpa]|uniref:Endonuclease/exonuclease/phosphatase domain-containing protein n=1 Tax=Riccia sorocarpa TaxID=122646 RepID=A0ABD3H9E2_9MARC
MTTTKGQMNLTEEELVTTLKKVTLKAVSPANEVIVQVLISTKESIKNIKNLAEKAIFTYYFQGEPAVGAFRNWAQIHWGRKLNTQVEAVLEPGQKGILTVLTSGEARDEILQNPHAQIRGCLVAHLPWTPEMDIEDYKPTAKPVQIEISGVPKCAVKRVVEQEEEEKESTKEGEVGSTNSEGNKKDSQLEISQPREGNGGVDLNIRLLPSTQGVNEGGNAEDQDGRRVGGRIQEQNDVGVQQRNVEARRAHERQGIPQLEEQGSNAQISANNGPNRRNREDWELQNSRPEDIQMQDTEERQEEGAGDQRQKRRKFLQTAAQQRSEPITDLNFSSVGRKGGTALLIKKEVQVLESGADVQGRMVWIKGLWGQQTCSIASIYAPNDTAYRVLFWDFLKNELPEGSWVLAGDWNAVSSQIDASSKSAVQGEEESGKFNALCARFGINDAREGALKKEGPRYTRAQIRDKKFTWSSIDRVYTSRFLATNVKHHVTFCTSDHIPVTAKLGMGTQPQRREESYKSPYFKVDPLIVKDNFQDLQRVWELAEKDNMNFGSMEKFARCWSKLRGEIKKLQYGKAMVLQQLPEKEGRLQALSEQDFDTMQEEQKEEMGRLMTEEVYGAAVEDGIVTQAHLDLLGDMTSSLTDEHKTLMDERPSKREILETVSLLHSVSTVPMIHKFSEEVAEGRIKALRLKEDLCLSIVCLADDVALYLELDKSSVLNTFRFLYLIQVASGGKWLYDTGIQVAESRETVRYLGAHLVTLRKGASEDQTLIDQLAKKAQDFSSPLLTFEARVTTLKHVVAAVLVYPMLTSTLKKGTYRKLDQILRKYTWTSNEEGRSKLAVTAWDALTAPKGWGGGGGGGGGWGFLQFKSFTRH